MLSIFCGGFTLDYFAEIMGLVSFDRAEYCKN